MVKKLTVQQLEAQLGLPTSGTSGSSGTITLPTQAQLMAKPYNIPAALAKQWGGKVLNLPSSYSNGNTIPIQDALRGALSGANMPGNVLQAVMGLSGLSDPAFSSVGAAATAVAGVLALNGGNLGGINVPNLINYSKQQAVLSADAKALASGNNAVLLGASQTAMYDAESSADSTLFSWGLDSPTIAKMVHGFAVAGMKNANEIIDQIRKTKAYNDAFPGLAEYNSSPGATHMTENQYMTYTDQIKQSATQFGAPMPSQAQIGELIKGNVSPVEYQQRVSDIYSAVTSADQNVKNILANQFGVNHSDLMAYYANPKNALPVMQRQVASAGLQDYAQRVGLNSGITAEGFTQLADMAKLSATAGNQPLGYGVSQIEQSLLTASRDEELIKSAPGAGTPTINTTQLIGSQLAGFGGTNQAAEQVQVARAEQAAAAPFEKGGGYLETNKGVTGIGSART